MGFFATAVAVVAGDEVDADMIGWERDDAVVDDGELDR